MFAKPMAQLTGRFSKFLRENMSCTWVIKFIDNKTLNWWNHLTAHCDYMLLLLATAAGMKQICS